MSKHPTVAELWTLLQEQQSKIESLEKELAGDRGVTPSQSNVPSTTHAGGQRALSRAGLLQAAAAGAVGVIAANQLNGTGTASANNGDNFAIGPYSNIASGSTTLDVSTWSNHLPEPGLGVSDDPGTFFGQGLGWDGQATVMGATSGSIGGHFDNGVAGYCKGSGIGVKGISG